MPDRPLAISVDGVSKDFRLPSEQRHTLKERVLSPRFDRSTKTFHALRDVSFEVERGEFFGIVGRNGSGKSTLLKCLAGIYRLDAGTIKIGGRLSTFIELGVGFNPDLAARDNIILNGIMLGLTPAEAAKRVDPVIRFAELEDHVDLKLKNYSSGMQVRLAFSVLTQVDADVLLIDEVLAVGDASFQAKCFDVFRQLREAGKTIVLVTHDMSSVSRFCDRAMLIEDGEVVDIGDPDKIGDGYLALNFEQRERIVQEIAGDSGDESTEGVSEQKEEVRPAVVANRALVVNDRWEVVNHVRSGDRAMVTIDVTAARETRTPIVTLELRDDVDTVLFTARSLEAGEVAPTLEAGEVWRLGVWIETLLAPGGVRVRALLHDPVTGELVQRSDDLLRFEVTLVQEITGGVTNLPRSVSWQPIEAMEEQPVPPLAPIGHHTPIASTSV